MRPLRPLLFAALLLSLAACGDNSKNERRLTLLFTTDEHSHLFALAPEKDDFPLPSTARDGSLQGGVARRTAILDAERARATSRGVDTLTVSAGDFSQGTLVNAAFLQSSPDLYLLQKMKYDAVALGNHEFDMGPAALAVAINVAAGRLAASGDELPRLLLTNLILAAPTGTGPQDLLALVNSGAIAPSRVITKGGLKIGLVSWLGAGAGTDAAGAAPVQFWPGTTADLKTYTTAQKIGLIVAQVQPVVDALRNTDKVDFVVALGHGGIGPLIQGLPGDDEAIASALRGVDVVISGHSHKRPDQPHLVIDPDGHYVPVIQPAPYGDEVGRVELVSEDGGRPVLDPEQTAFIAVDDRTVPTTRAEILDELNHTIDVIEGGFAPATLLATGICAPADTACYSATARGDLYYKTIGRTTFFTRGLGAGESNVTNLDTDAMLAIANEIAGATTVALQNYGSIRTNLVVGETGDLSFADLFRAVPNGADPGTGTAGFPLVRVLIPTVALRAALEGTLLQSMLDGDYFVSPSGLRVEYDITRAQFDPVAAQTNPFTPGWVTRMALADPVTGTETQLLYDVTQPGVELPVIGATHFLVNPQTSRQPTVATYYVASFASAFGVTLLDPANPLQPITPAQAILRWPTGTPGTDAPRAGVGNAVKDHQSLLKYVKAICDANGGNLPSRYDDATNPAPRRMVNCVLDPAACLHP